MPVWPAPALLAMSAKHRVDSGAAGVAYLWHELAPVRVASFPIVLLQCAWERKCVLCQIDIIQFVFTFPLQLSAFS